MFATIIAGVDARPGGRDALALAGQLSETFGGRLLAVHTYPYDYFVSRGADEAFESAMHRAAQETLEAELERAGVAAQAIATPDDSPGRALHRIAERERADLIVVGSAHRGPVGRVLAGDVTAGTLHGAPCPVLVAPRGHAVLGGELRTVGVAFDGSPESRAALDLARALAQAAGAEMRVIDVIAPLDVDSPVAAFRRDEAKHLDILVTGSRGYGPVRRVVLGSTSHKLVHRAPCPVLVLPRGAHTDGGIEEPTTVLEASS